MSIYVLRRLLQMIPVLFLVSVIAFGIILLLPGDPAMAILGPDKARDTAVYQEVRRELGLDKPIPLQYLAWLGKIVVGDFGTSAHYQAPVSQLIGQSIWPTVQLSLTAMLIALLIAVPIGIVSAAKPGSWMDVVGTTFALSGVAIPNFLLGILLILLFALTLRLLPSGGYVPLTQNPVESLRLMILPAFALGAGLAAVLMRQIRSAMLEVLNQDYVTTARAKGLAGRHVVLRHALKNALIPVLTVIGVQIGRLIGGTVVIETIFAVPGMGKLAVGSIFFRDFPVVQAIVLILGTAILLSNLITDLLYGVVDPRGGYSWQGAGTLGSERGRPRRSGGSASRRAHSPIRRRARPPGRLPRRTPASAQGPRGRDRAGGADPAPVPGRRGARDLAVRPAETGSPGLPEAALGGAPARH